MPTEEQLAVLKERVSKAEEGIVTATKELRTAERAGADVQPQRTRLVELTEKIKRVKTAYNI